jgi:hypothetical protein
LKHRDRTRRFGPIGEKDAKKGKKDKRDLCRDFFDDVNMPKDAWIKHRVHPFANAYISAYARYKKAAN